MKAGFWSAIFVLAVALHAQAPLQLPSVSVSSSRVAIQGPGATFAMPVSALRYEPMVDIHARNLTEGQADVTVRGGIFEGTGFRVGATTLLDPQTGHYLAELPVAPEMLTEPRVLTGSDLATEATNATAGGLAYSWRRIQSAGLFRVGFGQDEARRSELYQGYAGFSAGAPFGFDLSVARSRSDGAVPYGEHRFDRATIRLQRSTASSQTDVFAGYQAKFFGWPNLYTPFNSNETEDLETTLFLINHRLDLGEGDFLEAGFSHRRNKDDYAFNRFAPVGAIHPFQHTTWLDAAAVEGRHHLGETVLHVRGEVLADALTSTSLSYGRFRSRTISKIALTAERVWPAGRGGDGVRIKGGGSYDDSNRDSAAVSPTLEIARTFSRYGGAELYGSVSRSTQLPTYTAINSNPAAGLFRGNPNLGRQYSRNLELGFRGEISGWATQAAVFTRHDDSQVDWTFRRGVTARTANAVDLDVSGLELMTRHSWPRLDVVLGYTALTKEADFRGAAVDASFYALNYARHRLTAAFTVRVANGLEVRMDNVARLQAANLLRTTGGDEAIISSFAVHYRPPALKALELSAGVDNLWNSDYQEVPAVPSSPRRWFTGMALRW